jgi:hypothetical protein
MRPRSSSPPMRRRSSCPAMSPPSSSRPRGPVRLPLPFAAMILAFAAFTPAAAMAQEADGRRRDPVIAAAGDIACHTRPCASQRRTSELILRMDPTAVLTLGDNQYPSGALHSFRDSYDPTWGRFKRKTYPSPGNHEYRTPRARGYFAYFGRRAHGPRGYYSFNLASWHIMSVNTNTDVAGVHRGRQVRWLRRDLSADRRRCELAYGHHPRWTSGGDHGSSEHMAPFWKVLHRAGADVVLSGHSHNYERFARVAPAGRRSSNGIRQFVAGTGGKSLDGFRNPLPTSEKRINAYGVLELTLHERSYSWRFLRADGSVGDRGTTRCHR